MFSHVVLFWTKSETPDAVERLIAGAEKYLRPIPGVLSFHVGRMAASDRPVVDQSYQVGLNVLFSDKQAQDDYQAHPLHLDFIREISPVWEKVKVYDFC
jgi:hypothetical protein